ncbi:tetratricopeptidedomain 39C [Trypanosoma grayi]|uniref:tetratricopeptidedomain 39C n=1 Tax=Trypanosoma grayi TaxID=71804 RepID=UPI0004F42AFE|nr:tetratricopeptidedomain 39C [Trypanosoma grayi]KEG05929.1 tetratricopeptidedomain 39C [Trypanosoma grayi]
MCLPLAKKTAEEVLSHPPMDVSVLHLWLVGRIRRLERDIDVSTEVLSKCLEVTRGAQLEQAMPQLRDFALYDQAWNHATSMRWKDCISCHSLLEERSAWSKMFYAYVQGCCYEMVALEAANGDEEAALECGEEATRAFWRAAHYGVTRRAGRAVAIEKFVATRLNEIFHQGGVGHPNPGNKKNVAADASWPPKGAVLRNTVPLAMLELFVLFDVLHQLSDSSLEALLRILDQVLGEDAVSLSSSLARNMENEDGSHCSMVTTVSLDNCKVAVLTSIKAIMFCQMSGRRDDARVLLKKALPLARGFKGRSTTVSWMTPQMLYEEACLAFFDGDLGQCSKVLDKVQNINEHNIYSPVMESKVHFAKYAVRTAAAAARE